MSQNPNDRQVGGTHYSSGSADAPQWWDICASWRVPYLEGNAGKYIYRCYSKGSLRDDLQKAIHYNEKVLELNKVNGYEPPSGVPGPVLDFFCTDHKLKTWQRSVLGLVVNWSKPGHLLAANELIADAIKRSQN